MPRTDVRISNARSFNGTTDRLDMTLGLLTGAWGDGLTVAMIAKPSSDQSGMMLELTNGVALYHDDSLIVWFAYEIPDFDSYGNDPVVQDGWNLMCFTKPPGSSTVTLHNYAYTPTAWTHTAGEGGAIPAPGSPTAVIFGNDAAGAGGYKGLIAAAAVWKGRVLTNAQIEGLTGYLSEWKKLSPTALWKLDQSAVADTVPDLVGTSHQSSVTGTTVQAVSDLPFYVDMRRADVSRFPKTKQRIASVLR